MDLSSGKAADFDCKGDTNAPRSRPCSITYERRMGSFIQSDTVIRSIMINTNTSPSRSKPSKSAEFRIKMAANAGFRNANELIGALTHKVDLTPDEVNASFEFYKNHISSANDCLQTIVHLTMVQSGFSNTAIEGIPFEKKTEHFAIISYDNLKIKPDLNRTLNTHVKILINSSLSTSLLTVQAFHDKFKTKNILKATPKHLISSTNNDATRFTASSGCKLTELCISFKDSIIAELTLHLYGHLKLDQNFFLGKNLAFLPADILIKIIVQFLDMRSIRQLSLASRFFKHFLFGQDSNFLWKKLFLRDFKFRNTLSNSTCEPENWLREYKTNKIFYRFSFSRP